MTLKPTAPADDGPGKWDDAFLLARIRGRGISEAEQKALVDEAFRRTFATELGRFVLIWFAQACGVARRFGPGTGHADVSYSAGLHDAAVMLVNDAGYDDAAVIGMAMLQVGAAAAEDPAAEAAEARGPAAVYDDLPADDDFPF